mmetsp:Transcript_8199/g.14629  ORF Transcript_8199/g.14629 Transcript_8199/m.14629 type:complete len:228 (+) Transcript_8199:293-976(+)
MDMAEGVGDPCCRCCSIGNCPWGCRRDTPGDSACCALACAACRFGVRLSTTNSRVTVFPSVFSVVVLPRFASPRRPGLTSPLNTDDPSSSSVVIGGIPSREVGLGCASPTLSVWVPEAAMSTRPVPTPMSSPRTSDPPVPTPTVAVSAAGSGACNSTSRSYSSRSRTISRSWLPAACWPRVVSMPICFSMGTSSRRNKRLSAARTAALVLKGRVTGSSSRPYGSIVL